MGDALVAPARGLKISLARMRRLFVASSIDVLSIPLADHTGRFPVFESISAAFAASVGRKRQLNRCLLTLWASYPTTGGRNLFPRMLPGDRPLPGVAGGKLQSVLFDLGSFKDITVYVGDKNFGIFVPGPINIGPAIATFRLFIAKKRAGNLSLVGPDQNGENAGVLLLFDITAPAVQTWLKRILPPVRR